MPETPPRTWGRPVVIFILRFDFGNTPTHVGKTAALPPERHLSRKHPHARGEDPDGRRICRQAIETPPRTWGRQAWVLAALPCRGNTPTHVGKTWTLPFRPSLRGKHPHARGEDLHPHVVWSTVPETPPRTWGRPYPLPLPPCEQGNTPTHVGKTCFEEQARTERVKHPHARGEDPAGSPVPDTPLETPPRTWGRPSRRFYLVELAGNTPTHVGKTL